MKLQSAALAVALASLLSCPGAARRTLPTKKPAKGGGKVAVFVLEGTLYELKASEAALKRQPLVLPKLLRRLRLAGKDPKVGTVLLVIRNLQAGWAQLADLRSAVRRLREAGKEVIAFLRSPTSRTYYLATAAKQIVVPPGTAFWTVGLGMEVLFLKGLLDKLGVEAEFVKMGRYKGAAEPLTRKSMSKELRESLQAVLSGLYGHLVNAAAKDRGRKAEEIRRAWDQGPLDAEAARKAGLVDQVEHLDNLLKRLGGRSNCLFGYGIERTKPSLANLLQMLQPKAKAPKVHAPHVALIVAKGPILLGSAPDDLFAFRDVVASDEFLRTLRQVEENERVRAVVLRIDSPGGSALASEILWNAIRRLNRRKPVVVSMGDVAASGGYYIASAARQIFVQPGTLTGSIGVLGGKLVLSGLFHKLGLNVESLQEGARARILSPAKPFSPEERQALQGLMAKTYELFLRRVAQGRHMGLEQVRRMAEGRVWLGLDALRLRLADRLGGLAGAIQSARRFARLPEDAPTLMYPPPKNILQVLTERLGDIGPKVWSLPRGVGSVGPAASLLPVAGRVLTRAWAIATLLRRERVLLVAPWTLEVY